jgi:ribosomal subunit interface protein
MSITITGKHIEVGESLKQHAEHALVELINRYMGEPLEGQVVIAKDHHTFRVDITLHVSKHFNVFCNGSDVDAYKAFDSTLQKLEGQIKKYKTRLRDRKRKEGDYHTLPASYYVINPNHDNELEEAPAIIAESAKNIVTLSVGDAVMKMDLSDQPVVLFRNASHGELNVVYRRQDGNIGWIDPTKTLP